MGKVSSISISRTIHPRLPGHNHGGLAQSENPKEDDELQQKYISLVDSLYTWGEWWQLEQLCNEKADSISDDILAFGRGLTASRFFQIEEAKKQLSMCLNEYNETRVFS